MWVPYKNFFPLDDSEIRRSIDSEIVTILEDTTRYNLIKTDILNELAFHYVVASKLSAPEATKWVNEHMAGKRFKLHLTNYDPEFRPNDTKTVPYKKYISHLRYDSQKWLDVEFDLDLYTNNADYETMPLDSQIVTLGQFIKANVQIYIVTFGFSFDQLVPEI